MKVVISGGHLTPALAIIDYARQHYPQDEFLFAGRLYSQPTLRQRSWEKQEVSQRGVKFLPFNAPKLSGPWWQLPLVAVDFLSATWRSYQLLRRYRPDLFLSFGGYLAVPFALAARLQGIPVLTHEQTRVVGVANQWIIRLADAVAISFPETAKKLRHRWVEVTGNPLRPALLLPHSAQPEWLPQQLPAKPLLYITGGNQGSQCINVLVQQALPQLLKDWWIIHQCGSATTVMNYKRSLEKTKVSLPVNIQTHYYVREWVSDQELGWIYRQSAAVLSRAGANTVSELITMGRPALLIPLPQAHDDEQLRNAELMADAQAALILPQRDASAQSLVSKLNQVRKKIHAMQRQAVLLQDQLPTNAAQRLYLLARQVAGQPAGSG